MMTEEGLKQSKRLRNNPVELAHKVGFDKLGDMHNGWIMNMVNGHGDFTLQAHRGSYKTTCVSVALALKIILEPDRKIMFMRKTDGDVKEVIRQVQKILRHPYTRGVSFLIHRADMYLTTESATEVSTNLMGGASGTPQLMGIGSGSSITGKHFDYIFTDDIVNADDRISAATREETKRIYQELHNIRNQGGRIFNTGTPWHKDDAFSIMPEPDRYDYKRTGMLSEKAIRELKDSMLPSLFAANYELRHIPSEKVIFVNPEMGADDSMVEQGIMHLDSAYGGEDFTAWSIMRKRGNKYYLYGKLRQESVLDCYGDILADYTRFMCGELYTEKNADKGFVQRDLYKLGIKAIPYNEKEKKFIKITTHLKAIWKDVVFVKGTDRAYIEQIVDYYDKATHDDAPDSASCLARIMRQKAQSSEYKPLWN